MTTHQFLGLIALIVVIGTLVAMFGLKGNRDQLKQIANRKTYGRHAATYDRTLKQWERAFHPMWTRASDRIEEMERAFERRVDEYYAKGRMKNHRFGVA